MKTKAAWAVLILCGLIGLRLVADDAKKFEGKCPVSGGPAKEAHVVEFNGKKVYFCCPNCPKAFAKDSAQYMPKVHQQWAQTGQIVQVACPFTGGKLNKDAKLDIGGASIGFCCMNCLGKAKAKEGDDQVALVFTDIAKGFTLQNVCPVSGKPIDPASSVDYKGKKAYFCCPNCSKAFENEPAKFEAKLPQLKEGTKAEK